MKRLALRLLPPLFSILLVYLSIQSFLKIRSEESALSALRSQVDALRGKVSSDQTDLSYRKSSDFIYKEALEQLGLTKPGEEIVVLPDWEKKKKELFTVLNQGDTSPSSGSVASTSTTSYWEQWRTLFFGN